MKEGRMRRRLRGIYRRLEMERGGRRHWEE